MAAASSSQNKSWWRSKSSKETPILRTNSSQSSLGADAKLHAQNGPPKSKESKFNTFVASAMGKKAKKPNLTIQDPPTTCMPPSPSSILSFSSPGAVSPSPYFTNRPPAKSVSTERSYEFDQRSDPYTISEPRTPSDHARERASYQHSVMTFHDADPFAAGGITVPGGGADMSRLSVWSDNSLLDPHAKRGESSIANRMSCGSSSSNSHGNPADAQGPLPQLPVARPNAESIRSKRQRREASLIAEGAFPADLLTAAQQNFDEEERQRVLSKPSPIARFDHAGTFGRSAFPPVRPGGQASRERGKTVGEEQRAATHSHDMRPVHPPVLHRQTSETHMRTRSKSTISTVSPIMFNSARSSVSTSSSSTHVPAYGTRPLVLVRKASHSRVNLPPIASAPPSSRLPPPPLSPFVLTDEGDEDDYGESLQYVDTREPRFSASSNMTFASIELDLEDIDNISVLAREMILDDDLPFTPSATSHTMSVEPPPRRPMRPKPHSPSATDTYLTSPTNTLRKAASQQNMHKRGSQASVASASSLLSDEAVSPTSSNAPPNGRAPRKQRSFHHPRIPLPPIPALRHVGFPTNNPVSDAPPAKPAASNTTSPSHTRRRLFSGSSGRRTSISKSSTTPPATADDDLRSLSSLSTDGDSRDYGILPTRSKPVMMSFTNMGNQLSLVTDNACIAPGWEEMGMGSTPGRRASHGDYMMQHIMSPAEMLKLEQQFNGEAVSEEPEDVWTEQEQVVEHVESKTPKLDIDPGDFGLAFIGGGRSKSMRSRTDSLLSNMSAFGHEERKGGGDEMGLRGLVGVAQTFNTPAKRPSTANDATSRAVGWGASPARSKTNHPSSGRPSTAQPSLTSPPTSPVSPNSVIDSASGGLPPPPRPRVSREKQVDAAAKRMSTAPLQPLSPPPRRRPTLNSVASRDEDEASTPTSQSSRPPSAFGQKAFNRRSLAKKPSFLDIDDEWDAARDTVSFADLSVRSLSTPAYSMEDEESSFLDMDRGASFDTVRSFEDDIYGF